MEFLVHIEYDVPEELREALTADERRVGEQLRDEGVLRRIWRLPGRRANVGLWEAPDATRLHEALSSLPVFPWAAVEVTPLADHPLEAGAAHG